MAFNLMGPNRNAPVWMGRLRAAARQAAVQPQAAPAEDEPEEEPVSRSRSESEAIPLHLLSGVYHSPWIPLMANAGPTATDYAQRVGLGLDAAARPMVGPGVGGYASPAETDIAVGTFLQNNQQDRQQAMNQQRMQMMRLQAYMEAQRKRQEELLGRLGQYQ